MNIDDAPGQSAAVLWRNNSILLRFALPVVVLVAAPCAEASPTDSAVSQVIVECPELTSEQSAAIEARQLGELSMRGHLLGTLRLGCRSSEVFGSWVGSDGAIVSEFARPRTPGANPTEPLHLLSALILDSIVEQEEGRVESVAVGSVVSNIASSDSVAAEGVSDETPPTPVTEPALESAKGPTDQSTEIGISTNEPTPLSVDSDETPKTSLGSDKGTQEDGRKAPLFLFFDAAFRYQYWASEPFGSLGPELGGGVTWNQFGGAFYVVPQWSNGKVDGYSFRDLNLEAVASWNIWKSLYVRAGPTLSILRAQGPDDVQEGETLSTQAGVLIQGQLIYETRRAALVFRAGARMLGGQRQIVADGKEILNIPALQMLLSVGARFELFSTDVGD